MTAKDPQTRAAAEELRAAGCQALDELRDLIGVLRTSPVPDPEPVLPAPTAELAALQAASESVGVPVELVEDGDPRPMSPVVARTAYRVVQEGLTNVRKHALGARVVVRVRYDADQILITVRNTAAPRAVLDGGLAATGSHAGLTGLRQRIEVMGGRLRAGPTDDGGFELAVVLPAAVPTGGDPVGVR